MALSFNLATPTEEEDVVRLGFGSSEEEEDGVRLGFGSSEEEEEDGVRLGFGSSDEGNDTERTTLGFNLSEDKPARRLGFSLGKEDTDYVSTLEDAPEVNLTSLGEDYSVANLAKHDGIVQLASSIMEDREGEGKKEKETNEDIIERYITHMRYVSLNTVDVFQEVDYIKGLSKKKKDNYGIMMGIYEQMPNFMQKGGGSATSGVLDTIGSLVSDPTLIASMIIGGPVGSAAALAARQAGKSMLSKAVMGHVLKNNLGRITTATTLEGLTGAMHESQRQELNIEVGRLGKKDYEGIATAGALSAGLAVVGAGIGAAATVGKRAAGIATNAERVAKKLEDAKDPKLAAKRNEKPIDPITGKPFPASSATSTFDKAAAERIRDALHNPTEDFSAQVNRDIEEAVILVAENLMRELPDQFKRLDLENGTKEKLSDMVNRIIAAAPKIDDDVFEAVLSRTGLLPEEFAQINRLTAHEAGVTMNLYKQMGDRLKGMAENNPALKAKLKKAYGKDDEINKASGTFWGFLKRLDRESRALMVTQIATTARNVISAGGAITFGAAAKIMEGTLVHSYNAISGAITGNAARVPFKTGMMQTLDDATGAFRAIMGHKESADLAKLMLKDNARLTQTLFRSLQETGNETLSTTTKFLNGLNMMQDQVIRSGAFTDSVNRQMKKLDLDMYDYIANNKAIPVQVLKKATDDALEMTFALMPNKGTVLRSFVDVAESIPFATTFVFPFARFMADAMAFQYKYSPLNFVNAVGAYRSSKKIAKKSDSLMEQSADKLKQSKVVLSKTEKDALIKESADKLKQSNALGISAAKKKELRAESLALKKKSKGLSKRDKRILEGEARGLQTESVNKANISSRAMTDMQQRIGKGAVGSGLLYAAVLYRNDNQDIAWNTVGNSSQPNQPIDIRMVFPMAPYLAVADFLVKWHNEELVGTDSAAMLLEGLTGTALRPMGVMDSVNDLIETLTAGGESGDIVTKEHLGKAMGNWAGSITGRPFTSAQIFRDIYAAFDDTQSIVRETRMVDGQEFSGVFAHTFMNHIKSKVPVWQEDLPEYRSPTTGGTVRRQSAVINQFTGIKYMPKQNEVEKELANLGLQSFRMTPRTGNKQADFLAKKHMATYANAMISYQMASPLYKSLNKRQKSIVIENRFKEIKKIALEVAKGEAMMIAFREGKKYSVFDQGKWSRTPKKARELADEYFRIHYGKSVSELGLFAAGAKIGRALKEGM